MSHRVGFAPARYSLTYCTRLSSVRGHIISWPHFSQRCLSPDLSLVCHCASSLTVAHPLSIGYPCQIGPQQPARLQAHVTVGGEAWSGGTEITGWYWWGMLGQGSAWGAESGTDHICAKLVLVSDLLCWGMLNAFMLHGKSKAILTRLQIKPNWKLLCLSELASGVPGRVCWTTDHLLNVLLPPSVHLFSEIRLHQQQALGRAVSVSSLVFCSVPASMCLSVTQSHTLKWQTLAQHIVMETLSLKGDNSVVEQSSNELNLCHVMPGCSLACMCHSFHYVKKILETLFVHRISHGTMPLRNIFKVSELHFCDLIIRNTNQTYVDPFLLTYYSLSFYSRTVAITGSLQLGWRTTSTILSTPHPVSADHCHFSLWNLFTAP